jgi:eukaryotic-like serine/threonine-protein kinase
MGSLFDVGSVVAGKYRIEGFLACGGMGMVLAATHFDLDAPRALKIPFLEGPVPEDVAARFLREARTAARLTGEHVARVYDAGVLETGTPYIVMERLAGSDLAALLGRRGPLPVGDAALYVSQAGAALAEAHDLAIVHRDLKPANLFLTAARGAPRIKVIDFGVAQAAGIATGKHVEGSPAYMAPEQVSGGLPVDARADMWALGVTLYELLTGRSPFSRPTLVATFAEIVSGEPRPVEALRPNLPPGILAVLSRCLRKHPAQRFQRALDLVEALAPFALGGGTPPEPAGNPRGERRCSPDATTCRSRGSSTA